MILKFIKTFLRSINIEASFISKKSKPRYELFEVLSQHKVNLLFDIGANVGQFGSEIRDVGYLGKIISFEPLPFEHRLLEQAALKDALWTVHQQCAIGNEDGKVDINISGNSVSSSILSMSSIHENAAQSSAYVSKANVPLRKLDSVGMPYIGQDSRCFIKIDTQGFEWHVLDGASLILKNAIGVQIELSLVQLYEGQPNWIKVIQRMEDEGFILWKLQPGFSHPQTGQLLQCDGTFLKAEIVSSIS